MTETITNAFIYVLAFFTTVSIFVGVVTAFEFFITTMATLLFAPFEIAYWIWKYRRESKQLDE